MDPTPRPRDPHQPRRRPATGRFVAWTVNPSGLGARRVRVYLPSNHGNAPQPLLVLWDGQNVFEDLGSFAGGWQVHRAVERRVRAGRLAPVVAALDHGGEQRLLELQPFAARSQAPAVLNAVVDELVPRLYSTFKLQPGPQGMTVGGSSLGGLMSLWAHLQRPDVFGAALCMSPSLFAGRGAMFRAVEETPQPWASRVWLDAGGKEAGGRMAQLATRMAATLRDEGWAAGDVALRVVKSHGHNEAAWRIRFPRAMRFFWG